MYLNLKLELKRKGILQKEVAQLLDMTLQTFNNKLNGADAYLDFTINEKWKIYSTYFKDEDYGHVFRRDNGVSLNKEKEELKTTLINLVTALMRSNTGKTKEIITSDGVEEVEVYEFNMDKGAKKSFKKLIRRIENL